MRVLRSLCLAVGIFLLVSNPALAVANPDSISNIETYVFGNTLETGDWLIFTLYDVEYASEPTEDASQTFQMAMYHDSTLVASIPLNYYQENIQSIYFTAAQVVAKGLSWEHEYTIRIQGNPSIFTLVEDSTMDTLTLSAASYLPDTSLGDKMLEVADTLETDWAVTLLTGGKLNTTGTTYFLEAVPGLMTMDSSIFSVVQSYMTSTVEEQGTDYLDNVVAKAPTLDNAFSTMGGMIGVSQGYVAMFATAMGFMLVVALMYPVVKEPGKALIASFPVVMIMAFVGVSSDLLVFVGVMVVISALLFGIIFILGRFA